MGTGLYEDEIVILNLGSSTELQVNMPSGPSLILDLDLNPDISMNHFALSNIGTNTHAQIDSHIASNSNPHSVTKTQVGLPNVDNTSDLNKPISTATQTALDLKANISHTHTLSDITQSGATNGQVPEWDGAAWVPTTPSVGTVDHGALIGLSDDDHTQYHNDTRGDARYFTQSQVTTALNLKADLASPALTGNPTAPTQSGGNNSTRIATTAFVQAAATPDATSLIKGKIQLTGDLGGSAGFPTVPKLPLPYYTESTIIPTGNDYSTALDLEFDSGYSSNCRLFIDASATSGQGIRLGDPTGNFRIELVNLGPQTLNIYPKTGHTIFRFGTEVTDEIMYIRGDETMVITGVNTTTWDVENAGVDLSKGNVFGILPQARGGTGTNDGSGLPYLSQYGGYAYGTYQFDVLAFGTFNIYDSNHPYYAGFGFTTSTNTDFFEMYSTFNGQRIIGHDANNNVVYFGGSSGAYDGLAWDPNNSRVQCSSIALFGNWEFDGVDALVNSDGVITSGQLKYWDSSVFDISSTGINFMNSNVNIAAIANGGNLGVGASASATRKIWSQSTSNPQLSLAYNNSTAFVDFTVASTGGLTFKPAGNTTNGFRWQNAAGTTDILSINTTNTEISMGIGANTVGFFRGGSNVTPQFALGASGGKAVSLLAGTSGAAFAYDSTGTFAISTDTRANIVAGTSSGGTQRIGMTSAGLVMIGAGTSTAQCTVATATANADIFRLSNTDASFGNSYTFKISNGSGGGSQKNLYISGGNSSNDAVLFENTMAIYMGTTVGTNNGVYIGDNNNTAQAAKALFHVGIDTATMPTIDANTGIIVSNASATGDSASLSIIAGNTGFSTVNFGDASDENVGYIQYGHTSNEFTFGVNTNPRMYINNSGVGAGVSPTDTLTVGSGTNGTNIVFGIRTLTSGGSSMRTLMTQNASTGALDWAIDQGGNGSARAFNLTLSGVTALAINSAGAITITAGQSIGSSSAKNIFNASSATAVVDFDINASSTANNTFFRLGNGTMSTASSGITRVISSTPSINQSGTAGYTALNINVTETATGSGAKNLVLLGVDGVERFSIDNGGIVKASAQVRLKGYTVATLPTGTQGDTCFVTDALAPTFNTTIVGGGAIVTKVFYNGTNWIAG